MDRFGHPVCVGRLAEIRHTKMLTKLVWLWICAFVPARKASWQVAAVRA